MERDMGWFMVNRGNRELRDMKRVPKASFYWLQEFLKKQDSRN